jgi:ABC-type nickel/cobalt efflux system permease component RcnA
VLRALIAAALLTAAAIHFGVPPATAVGYALVACLAIWFVWPLLRGLNRLARRARRRRSQRAVAPQTATRAPALTQINHYHYYGHYYGHTMPPPAPGPRPDPTRLALPRHGRQQIAHNQVYDTFDDT